MSGTTPTPPTPRLANWLISRFVKADLHEELLGDLVEIYQDRVEQQGRQKAAFLYWLDALHLLLGFGTRSALDSLRNLRTMHRHYLTVAFRSIRKTWGYSLINIMGLAVGMGVCIAICQYIYFENSYDRFHAEHDNIYRVVLSETNSKLQESYPFTGYGLGVDALTEIPEIQSVVRKNRFNRGAVVTNPTNNMAFHEENNDLFFVDSSFFHLFQFPLLRGQKSSLFNDRYSMVITESTARKYFGEANPIGQTLIIDGPPSPGKYTVTGVVQDPAVNTHLQFSFLVPIQNYIDFGWGGAVKKKGPWNGFNDFVTYLSVESSAKVALVEDKLNQLLRKHHEVGNPIIKKASLQPITDIYLKSDQLSDIGYFNTVGNQRAIQFFSIISFLILLVAWINYINLATAKASKRTKEVGIRKSLGALRRELINQFLLESIVLNTIAAILAVGVAVALLPVLNSMVGKNLGISLFLEPIFWLGFVLIVLLGALLSGLYPAFVLSSYDPIGMLRSNKQIGARRFNLRQGLIVFQFLAALLLIAGTNLIYQQTTFMKGQELGIDVERVLILRGPQERGDQQDTGYSFTAFKNELLSQHTVTATTGSFMMPGQYWTPPYWRPGESAKEAPHTRGFPAAQDFPETYGLQFVAGHSFDASMLDELSIIINEAAVDAFGFASAESAIREQLVLGDRKRTIVGVVEDFHWHSLAEAHTPYIIQLFDEVAHPYLSVRIDGSQPEQALSSIQAVFQNHFPDTPFEYHFADDVFNRQYQTDLQFGSIVLTFTLLAIFIACLGLFALVSYSASARQKELGVRKILGASVSNLMAALAREYLLLQVIAVVVAAPLIVYGSQRWLQRYAFRIDIGLSTFVIPIITLLLISIATIGYRTYAAAKANPVEALKS